MNYTVEDIKLINKTTTEFYNTVAKSFSETRQHEWDGWKKALPFFENCNSVLDLGCGNCRFEKFLFENNINPKQIDCIDNSSPFLSSLDQGLMTKPLRNCHQISLDVIKFLLNNELNLKSYDLAVCFGVMHHLSSFELREKLLNELTKSKIAIVSFWQFSRDERIFNKAKKTTEVAKSKLGLQNLEDNDFFLGWQDREDVFRFCHNFTDSEIEDLKNSFNVIEEFSADKCNKYLVIKN